MEAAFYQIHFIEYTANCNTFTNFIYNTLNLILK